jgi:hypothetical protein
LSAKALPTFEINKYQSDHNWFLQVEVITNDQGAGTLGHMFIDGIQALPEHIQHIDPQYYFTSFTWNGWVNPTYEVGVWNTVGYHTIGRWWTLGQESVWLSGEYIVLAPTSDAPQVPDGGATAALLIAPLAGIALARRMSKRSH